MKRSLVESRTSECFAISRRDSSDGNPLGAVWSAAMMLDHLGHAEASREVVDAMKKLLSQTSVRTRDMGGAAGTREFSNALLEMLS